MPSSMYKRRAKKPRGIPKKLTFDGSSFRLIGGFRNRRFADQRAATARRQGFNARVVERLSPGGNETFYLVYIRKRGR